MIDIIDTARAMDLEWYAVEDDLIGGWNIQTTPKRHSEIDSRPENASIEEFVIGSFLDETLARYIVHIHNLSLLMGKD